MSKPEVPSTWSDPRKLNLVGQVFTRLTVVAEVKQERNNGSRKYSKWQCLCTCGKTYTATTRHLRAGTVKSCGCFRSERATKLGQITFENLVGKVFNSWTVLSAAPSKEWANGKKSTCWNCKCVCGTERVVFGGVLKDGRSKSCGCANKGKLNGESYSREYRIWKGMLARCNNKNATSYENYGGRGIKVCERWLDYKAFLEDMGRAPSKDHTLDREKNDLDYCKDNCRWATWSEQNSNRRPVRSIDNYNLMELMAAIRGRDGYESVLLAEIKRLGYTLARPENTEPNA